MQHYSRKQTENPKRNCLKREQWYIALNFARLTKRNESIEQSAISLYERFLRPGSSNKIARRRIIVLLRDRLGIAERSRSSLENQSSAGYRSVTNGSRAFLSHGGLGIMDDWHDLRLEMPVGSFHARG
jgi:hypothetical protein